MKRSKPHRDTQAFEQALSAKTTAPRYQLRLFVSGTTPRSARAIQNIREICDEQLPEQYDLEVIDIYQHPEHLKPEQIIVTPTLIKALPFPVRKIIGDLSDKERVLVALDIVARALTHQPREGKDGA